MKKGLIFLLLVFLFGCSDEVHENISEEMAEDSRQVLNVVEEAIKDERGLTEHESDVLHQYYVKYSARRDYEDLTPNPLSDEEESLFFVMEDLATYPEFFMTLGSGSDDFDSLKDQAERIIQTGSIHK